MGQWIRGRLGIGTKTTTSTSGTTPTDGGTGGGVSTPQLAGLNVTPSTISGTAIGQQIQINAAPIDQFGNLFQSPVTFQSLDQTVAIVSAGGLVTIEGNGNTQILVTAGSFTKTVTVGSSIVVPVYHLAWTTKPSDLAFASLGITGTPVAKLYDANNVLATSQPAITLAVTDPTIFGLSGSTLTSLKNGSSVITASAPGVPNLTDTATVNQVPASISGLPATLATDNNSTGKFIPVVKDANGQTVTNVTPTFLSNNTSIIDVDAAGNWTTVGKVAGNTTVKVTAGTVSVTFNISVSAVVGGNTPNLTTGQYLMGSTGSAPMVFDDATRYVSDADWKQKRWGNIPCTNVNSGIATRGNAIGVQGAGVGDLYTDGRNSVLARWNSAPTQTFKSNNFNPGFNETCFEYMIEGANLPRESETPEGFHYGLPNFLSSVFVVERAYQPNYDSSGEDGNYLQATGDAHIYNTGGTLSNGTVVPSAAPGNKNGPYVMGGIGRDGLESAHLVAPSCQMSLEQNGANNYPSIPQTNANVDTILDGTLYQWEYRSERWLSTIDNLWHGMTEFSYRKKGTTAWTLVERYIGTFPAGHGSDPYYAVDPGMKNCNHAHALDAHLMWWMTRWALWNADSNYDPMGSRAYYASLAAPAPTAHTFNSFNTGTGVYVGNVTIDGAFVAGLRPYKNGVAIVGQDYTIPREYLGRYISGLNSGHILPTVTPSVNGIVAGDIITWHSINGLGNVEVTGSAGVSAPAVPNAPTAANATAQTSNSLTFPVTLNNSGSLPTALAIRISTDNATWTNLSDVALSNPTLGQVLNVIIGGRAGSQLYYVQFAEKNTLGQSAWSASATGTTSAIVAVAHSSLVLNKTNAATGAAPTGTKSTTLPLATNTTDIIWQQFGLASTNAGGAAPYIYAVGNGGPSSLIERGFVSMPLVAQVIPAMSYTFKYSMYSESGYAYQLAPVIYVWRPSTNTVVGYIIDSATGIGNPSADVNGSTGGRVATKAGASITVQDGDILCFEAWFVSANAPASNYFHMQYDGPNIITEGSDGNLTGLSTVDFATAINFQS